MGAIKGDFAKLRRWSEKIRNAGGASALRELSANLAEETLDLIAEGFREQRDPLGKAWKPKKISDGRMILVGKTARLRRGWHRKGVTAQSFRVGPSVNYAGFHQKGTRRMVARKMVPDGGKLPAAWNRSLTAVTQQFFKRHFR